MVTDYASAISRKTILPAAALVLLALAVSPSPLLAQGRVFWQEGGVELCDGTWNGPVSVSSDSTNGAIIIWGDERGSYARVYAQRVSHDGECLWTLNGVLFRDDAGLVGYMSAVSDGKGGAIAAWEGISGAPYMNLICAQRVDSSGIARWGPYGVTIIGTNEDRGFRPALVSDGKGGGLVAWEMHNYGMFGEDSVAVCRVDGSGNLRWSVLVTTGALVDHALPVCEDGERGLIVAWTEWNARGRTVRVQRVDSSGQTVWAAAGVRPCTTSYDQFAGPAILAGDGGPVVSWIDTVNGLWRLWSQRFDLEGNRLWGLNGKPVRTGAQGPIWSACTVRGDSAKTVWLWKEKRGGTYNLFAQVLDSSGNRLWDTLGVFVGSTNFNEFRSPSIQTDGHGGAIAAWRLVRSGNWDIYAQRMDASGRLCWSDTGLGVCVDTNLQRWRPVMTGDGNGGAIVAWGDYRYGPPFRTSVYVQRIGEAVGVSERFTEPDSRFWVSPNPASGEVEFMWRSLRSKSHLSIYDTSGKLVRSTLRAPFSSGMEYAVWDGRDDRGNKVPSGMYFCVLEGPGARQFCKVTLLDD